MQIEATERRRHLDEHRGYLLTLARRRIGARLRSRVDPPDLVQQTILRAFESVDRVQVRGMGPTRVWLRTILVNLITDTLRRTGGRAGGCRERSLEGGPNSEMNYAALLVDDLSTPSQKVQRREAAIVLSEALDRLPEDQRLAVKLRHLDELPLNEVAERMDRSVASVAGLLRRGLDGLRSDQRLHAGTTQSKAR